MKKPESPKERNLIKGALRRVFSRSELRRQALAKNIIEFSHPEHPRVTRWAFCDACGTIGPAYKMQVDHIIPVIPVGTPLEQLSWDTLVERLWCDINNLSVLDKSCHELKSKAENKERRLLKKAGK